MAVVAVAVKVCDKCDKPEVVSHTITVNGVQYILELCERDSDRFLRDMSAWTSIGQEQEKPRTFLDEVRSDARRIVQLRERDAERQRQRDEAAAAMETRERDARRAVPAAARWDLTEHARVRMHERGFTEMEVFLTVTQPEIRIDQSWKSEGRAVYVRHGCKVVVAEASATIVTVLSREAELDRDPRLTAAAAN